MRRAGAFRSQATGQAYRVRIQVSLAATLLLANLIVQWWPAEEASGSLYTGHAAYGEEVFTIEEILPTRQLREQKLPPAPPPPLVEPAEVLFEELDLSRIDSLLIAGERAAEVEAAERTSWDWAADQAIQGSWRGRGSRDRKRRPRCVCENHE